MNQSAQTDNPEDLKPMVLILDSDELASETIRLTLANNMFGIKTFLSPCHVLSCLKEFGGRVRILFLAHPMAGVNTDDLIRDARAIHPGLGIVLMDSLNMGSITGEALPVNAPDPTPGPAGMENTLKISKPPVVGTLIKAISMLCPQCTSSGCLNQNSGSDQNSDKSPSMLMNDPELF